MFHKIFPVIFALLIFNLYSGVHAAAQLARYTKQGDALRIEITKTGMYWLSYEDMVKTGIQPQFINPTRLRLFNQGQEVAIGIVADDPNKFQPTDYIKFYAQAIDNNFTGTNVYWLYWRKKGRGKRTAYVNGQVTGQAESIPGFYDQLHFEHNKRWDIQEGNPDTEDYWFWHKLQKTDVKNITINLPDLPFENTDIIVRTGLRGHSSIAKLEPDHHTLISWNNALISDEYWDGNTELVQEMVLASEKIEDKRNTLTLELPGDTEAIIDIVYLNWIEVDYWRHFTAINDQLSFTVNGSGKALMELNGFSQPDILIFDVTDPNAVAEVINFSVETGENAYKAVFEDNVTEVKTYHATTLQKLKKSLHVSLWKSARLKNIKNRADYILITAKEFLPSVEPLLQLRRRQGLQTKAVSVEDIYNEFNYGIFDPAAIKAFLRFAYDNWRSPTPLYVFLVGDASLDYRSNLRGSKKNKVPAHLYLAYGEKTLLIPDDNWYVNVWDSYMGNYILPEMMIGRIPGDIPETVTRLVNKIIHFEETTQQHTQKILMIADEDAQEAVLSDELIKYIPEDFEVNKIYLRSYLEGEETQEQKQKKTAKASRDIISSINEGAIITNFTGHGSRDRWSRYSPGLLRTEQLNQLKNKDNLTFLVALTCNNGYFTDPEHYSLAEKFILSDGGAIGVFSSTGFSYALENSILAQEIFSIIFEQTTSGPLTLGYLTTEAKIAAYHKRDIPANVISSFVLFGDPATQLKGW